ncbi:MAG TPA: multiheme c-type cytochrome [Anaerolineae bacterium]|nr:multiheme c-type cytochrome [Anaerolineae bacterium]
MSSNEAQNVMRSARLLVIGLVAVILVLGLALVTSVIGRAVTPPLTEGAERVDALAASSDECVICHRRTTPGIVEQYGHSTMAAAEVVCRDCHEVNADYPGAIEHEDTYVLGSPTTAMCQKCHQQEVAQFYQSRHSLPAYVAYAGPDALTPELQAQYRSIPEAQLGPIAQRSVLFDLEGPDVTPFACVSCHSIGDPKPDGSVGECQKCHLRHEFSLEQARKPETCNACHIGPDHPQWEIYEESPHGIAYLTGGDNWHWTAEPGTLNVNDFPAPTCATCHFSGFGASGTTHDAGDRLTWYLFAPISERRPVWQDNKVRMQNVCLECHNRNFLDTFYTAADTATEAVNARVRESDQLMQPLKDQGLLTSEPFDEPIDFTYFELWHHWGRTAKFGVWMQGPDYTQWHGIYEVLSDLAELREMVDAKLNGAGE